MKTGSSSKLFVVRGTDCKITQSIVRQLTLSGLMHSALSMCVRKRHLQGPLTPGKIFMDLGAIMADQA